MENNNNNKKHNNNKLRSLIGSVVHEKLKTEAQLKSYDQGITASVSTTGSIGPLTTIIQGTTDTQRIGDMVEVVKTTVNGSFANSTTDITNVIRLIIFRWMQDDTGSVPVVADILQGSGVYNNYNRDNLRAKKFIVLNDIIKGTSLQGPAVAVFQGSFKQDFRIKFQAATSAATSQIYYLAISDSGAVNHPTLNMIHRTWYIDV
jgi:hypothetical protein